MLDAASVERIDTVLTRLPLAQPGSVSSSTSPGASPDAANPFAWRELDCSEPALSQLVAVLGGAEGGLR